MMYQTYHHRHGGSWVDLAHPVLSVAHPGLYVINTCDVVAKPPRVSDINLAYPVIEL